MCLLYSSISIFPSCFCLVNDLSLDFRCCCFVFCFLFLFFEMRTILFLFLLPFVSFCCMNLYFMFTAVSYQMFFD